MKYNKNITQYILTWAKKIKTIDFLGGKCLDCGCNNIFMMEFHHKDPKEKEFKISDIKRLRWSKIKNELAKCELLCSNCHIKTHMYLKDSIDPRSYINKQIFLEYKNTKKCLKCNLEFDNISVASFHHRKNTDKKFEIGNVYKRFYTIDQLTLEIKNEINKCDVVCRNCHKLEHIDLEKFKKYKQDIYKKSETYKENDSLDHELIKKLYIPGIFGIKKLARKFNASTGSIHYILNK